MDRLPEVKKKKELRKTSIVNGNTVLLTRKMHWFPTPNEKTARICGLKFKISKMWLPLLYIAHKSTDTIALVFLNNVYRVAKGWSKKEKYGQNSMRYKDEQD